MQGLFEERQTGRDIVGAAGGVGGINEACAGTERIGSGLNEPRYFLFSQWAVKPVATDEVAITRCDGCRPHDVWLEVRFDANAAGELVAAGIGGKLVRGEQSLAYEVGANTVVLRELLENAVTQTVCARVSDVVAEDPGAVE